MCEWCGSRGKCAVCGLSQPSGEILAVCRRFDWFVRAGVQEPFAVDYARAESWYDEREWRFLSDPPADQPNAPCGKPWVRVLFFHGSPVLVTWLPVTRFWMWMRVSPLVVDTRKAECRIAIAQLVSDQLKAA